MTAELWVSVQGRPARQGSKSYKGTRTVHGKQVPIMVEADENLPAWRAAVVTAARTAAENAGWVMLDEAVDFTATVLLPRPKTVTREYPISQSDGDGDKYVRALFDALTIAGVWADDSRVVQHFCRKTYASQDRPAGALIRIRAIGANA